MMGSAVRHASTSGWLLFVVLLASLTAHAQPGAGPEPAPDLRLVPPARLGVLQNRPITRIEVVTEGGRWAQRVTLRHLREGELLNPEAARRALRELTDSGRYAAARAEAEAHGGGVLLRLIVLPRRLVSAIRLVGGIDVDETLRASGVREGGEVTAPELSRIAQRLRVYYARRGFPRADVRADTQETDDPLAVVLLLEVRVGSARKVSDRWFGIFPDPDVPGLREALAGYEVDTGDRADEETLDAADRALLDSLRARGWQRAEVSHRLERIHGGTRLHVLVRAGPLVRLRFEGNQRFDATQIEEALELEIGQDRAVPTLVERLRDFYVARGFLDVEITASERGQADSAIVDLVFRIVERQPVRVVAREYPCLTGERTAAAVGSEIDSFLSEELPGGELLEPVDPGSVDALLGPTSSTGARPRPFEPNPWLTFVPDVYERAMKHVQDLYRSEGYLSATVGPAQLLRRTCHPRSPPGRCIVVRPMRRPPTRCLYDEIGLPLEEPPTDEALSCVPDPARGVRCEPAAVLHLPIKLGPRTVLYDLGFEGNRALVESELLEAVELDLGEPLSQLELEKARRRLMDAYAEQGFAFADVEVALDLSPDHSRGRARFIVSEHEQVIVSGIVIRGARITSERLIRSRVALEVGQPYRRSWVRQTEERLATLGVFSTITVGFEDPYVPAREKVVVISVSERKAQYLDVKPGFSTGEGFRITFEYGHRNLFGEAIQLTLRSQLGYLPSAFIFEEDVRRKFDELEVGDRLERRNTATLEFPDIGLGPLFRLSVEAVDVRDNARDFGLNKDAGIVTLIFRPERRVSVQLGGSLELNDVEIFDKIPLLDFLQANPNRVAAIRVPTGTTVVVAERLGASWDRRDDPLGATRGTFLSAGVEHVRATPIADDLTAEEQQLVDDNRRNPFEAVDADFLRYTNRLAGYLPLDDEGLALALSFRWGFIQHLINGSRTYPDRLFFMGGIDSIRGYLQDSMVPEDVAAKLLDPDSGVTLEQIVIRGGDVFLNPRAELRIPLTSSVQTALFLDAGNLWTDPAGIRPFELRYAVGSGLRIATPIGPLVFDYGFNLHSILDELGANPSQRRAWEDIGAFHFSIGLF